VPNKRQPGDSPRTTRTTKQSGVSTPNFYKTRRLAIRFTSIAVEIITDQYVKSNGCCVLCFVTNSMHTCLYDTKMCDTDYITDSTFQLSVLSDILSCDKPCRNNGFSPYTNPRAKSRTDQFLLILCIKSFRNITTTRTNEIVVFIIFN